MTEQEQMFLYALLSRVPGKTAQQKLNYIQDWAKGANIDLFGTGEQYVPSEPPVVYNKTAELYGNKGNEALDSIFNSIRSGVDPFTAVEQARQKEGGLPNEYQKSTRENGIDYTALAQQFAADEFDYNRQLAEWQAGEQRKQAEFETNKPAALSDLLRSKYDVASEALGRPLTAQNLLEQYGRKQMQKPSVSATSKPVAGPPMPIKFSANPEEDKILRDYVTRTLNKRIEQSRSQVMPTEKAQAALSMLPLFGG